MKKVKIAIVYILIFLFVMLFPLNNAIAANNKSHLQEFIDKNKSTIQSMKKADDENVIKKSEFTYWDDATLERNKTTFNNAIKEAENKSSKADKIKQLEETFEIYYIEAYGENGDEWMEDNMVKLAGLMLGYQKLDIDKRKDLTGKSTEDLYKEFDDKYKKWEKLSDKDKKANATKYYTELHDILWSVDPSEVSTKDYKERNDKLEKIRQVKDNAVEGTGVLGQSSASGDHSVDEIIDNADDFINAGKSEGSKISTGNLKKASNTLYNMLLTFGIVLAVIIGMYLGVKFMLASAEDKAKVKESLIPYVAGCVVIFSGFVIWKLAILLLGGIA